jgi:uncharacterized protein
MLATFNLKQLEKKNLHLEGSITPQELDLTDVDELIHVNEPLSYVVDLEMNGDNIVVNGSFGIELDCECARCLKPFKKRVEVDPWSAVLPLSGEEAVPVNNDCVDLTPFLREDTLLAFPQHPLCKPECSGLLKATESAPETSELEERGKTPFAWAELNKLKLK